MASQIAFLTDLTVALAAAALCGGLAARLRVNPILGYLAAGIAIGPFTPGYVARSETLDTLAIIGLIFLLFSLGLGFSLDEIRAVGARGLAGNGVAMAVIAGVAAGGAVLLHLAHPLTLALTVAVSSTAVGAAMLRTLEVEALRSGRYALAQLVVQDLVSVALLVVTTVPADALSVGGVLLPVLRAIAFVAVALLLGATVLHRVVARIVARASSDGMFIAFAALALVAAWLGNLAGLSFEFGAFVAGAVISEAAGSRTIASVVAPFRALFIALFFVSVGMLLDLHAAGVLLLPILAFGAVLTAVRFGAWTLVARVARMTAAQALAVAVAMTALGEFNVVLIDEALHAHRLDAREQQLLLGITFLSIIATVVLGPLAARAARGRDEPAVAPEGFLADAHGARVTIVGFGRVGATVGALLDRAGIAYAVLEHDRTVVERAQAAGEDVVLGDGVDPVALERVVHASTAIVLTTVPDAHVSALIVKRLAHRPHLRVIARALHARDVAPLRSEGATLALVPEAEGALVFARAVLRALGLDDDAIERHVTAARERSPALADPDLA